MEKDGKTTQIKHHKHRNDEEMFIYDDCKRKRKKGDHLV